MAQDYPQDPCNANQTPAVETSYKGVHIPGRSDEYQIEIDLDKDELIEDGELLDASVVNARRTVKEFIGEEDYEAVGIFLGYAENDWTRQDMWRESEYGRGEVFAATNRLDQNYGLVEVGANIVDLSEKGEEAYEFFKLLSEDELL